MAQIVADRVKETSTTTSTGSYSLAGAATGFRAFSSVCANNDTVYYAAVDQAGSGWEVGLGTWATGNTLARTNILASSNSGNAVDWAAGTRDVFLTHPARAATVDVQEFTSPGTSTWTKPIGARIAHIVIHAAGGGGGSGRRRAVGDFTNSMGGYGGVPGGFFEMWVSAASLSATETVIVGSGGSGGAARTVDGTSGAAGGNGSVSSFKSWTAQGGFGGFGGLSSSSTGTSGTLGGSLAATFSGTTLYNPYTTFSGAGTPAAAGCGAFQGGAGAGGGAIVNSSPTTGYAGGVGGQGGAVAQATASATGGGGTGGTASGGAGGAGAAADDKYFGGSGGGGGGNGTAQAAGAGGAGGYPGGGGGGGGAGNAGYNSGAGGAGADGYVRVTTYF